MVAEQLKQHGEAARGKWTPEYKAWRGIKARCYIPGATNYSRYGGRGITMHDSWRNDYLCFLNEIGRRPSSNYSVERIDNTQGYVPGNVRWATSSEQARNRRSSRFIEFQGETHTMVEWAELKGMSIWALSARLNGRNWSVERALTTPINKSRHRRDADDC